MRLIDLDPRWLGAGGEGITRNGQPVPERKGVGIAFRCPCAGPHEEWDSVYVCFENPTDGGPPHDSAQPLWAREGDSFDALTLRPSILRIGGCGWHGFITNGEVSSA